MRDERKAIRTVFLPKKVYKQVFVMLCKRIIHHYIVLKVESQTEKNLQVLNTLRDVLRIKIARIDRTFGYKRNLRQFKKTNKY